MKMRDDEDVIGERLGRALEDEARRSPLPFDFAATAVGSLDDRSMRRPAWFSSLPVVAVTVLLAILAVAVPLSLSRSPTTPDPATSGPTTEQPTAAPSASSSASMAAPTLDASLQPLTTAEAEETAIRADGRPGMTAVSAQFGPARQVLPREGFEWADVPSDETWIWLIVVSDGGPPLGQEGSFVVLDYFDGTVYGIQRWIS